MLYHMNGRDNNPTLGASAPRDASAATTVKRRADGRFETDDEGFGAVVESKFRADPECVELAKTDSHRAYSLAIDKASQECVIALPSRSLTAAQLATLSAAQHVQQARDLNDQAIHERALSIQQADGVDYGTALRRVSDEMTADARARQR